MRISDVFNKKKTTEIIGGLFSACIFMCLPFIANGFLIHFKH